LRRYLLGLACAGVQTLLSGFASIYFEMVLKCKAGVAAAAAEAGAYPRPLFRST
jgi:hypothetical protein